MSEILQTQQGQNVRYGCTVTGQALTENAARCRAPFRPTFVTTQSRCSSSPPPLRCRRTCPASGSSASEPRGLLPRRTVLQFDTARLTAAGLSSRAAAGGGGGAGRFRHPRRVPWRPTPSSSGRRSAGLRRAVGPGVQAAAGGRSQGPGDGSRLSTHQRQWDIPAPPGDVAHADAVQQGAGSRGERCAAGGVDGDPEGAYDGRAEVLCERQPAVRGVGAGQRIGAHAADAGADGRAERHRERGPRRTGLGLGIGFDHCIPAADRVAPPPPRHGGGPRAGRHRPPEPGRRRPVGRRTRAGLPAHGPPPVGGPLRRVAHLRSPLRGQRATYGFDEVYAGIVEALVAAAVEVARNRWSTPCPARHSWPNEASTCCAPMPGSR